MIFHENRLLADYSDEISCLIFVEKMSQNLSSAAVVIGALRVRGKRVFQVTWNFKIGMVGRKIFLFC